MVELLFGIKAVKVEGCLLSSKF